MPAWKLAVRICPVVLATAAAYMGYQSVYAPVDPQVLRDMAERHDPGGRRRMLDARRKALLEEATRREEAIRKEQAEARTTKSSPVDAKGPDFAGAKDGVLR